MEHDIHTRIDQPMEHDIHLGLIGLSASVNIMFHGLINPCIHLMESHQLYIILFNNTVADYISGIILH